TLLSRLSAFIGGCTEQAAKDVCDADPDQLRALATKSLLRRQNGRYTMLDTIHELAEELLETSVEREQIRTAHANWYLDLAPQARSDVPILQTAPFELVRQWANTFERELDNLRAAFRCFLDHAQKEQALRLADAMPIIWGRGGRDAEADRW